jgi:hypothetical protein
MPKLNAEPRHVVVLREILAGTALVVVLRYPAVLLSDSSEGRVLMIAAACGVLAAWCADWVSRAGIAVLGALVFVLFVAYQPGLPDPWPYTPAIVLAVILGAGYRQLVQHERDEPLRDR